MATFGVIVGLGLVVYEIRENNSIAHQQAVSNNWTNWTELEASLLQSDFPEVFAKSMTNPDELTRAEQVLLDTWLSAAIAAFEHDYASMLLSGGKAANVLQEMAGFVPYYFGNKFTRGWYLENRTSISADIVRTIDETLASTPIGSDEAYFDRVMNQIP